MKPSRAATFFNLRKRSPKGESLSRLNLSLRLRDDMKQEVMRNEIQERIRRSMEREKAEKAKQEADPDGRATYASGHSFTQTGSTTKEPELAPVIETPDNSLTFEAEVERNSRKVGIGGSAQLGALEMKLKRGGSLTGTLGLSYLNAPLLQGLSKLRKDGSNLCRKFKLTISIEEA